MHRIKSFASRHPQIQGFAQKVMKDNIGTLARIVAWTLLTSIVPIVAGLIAISSLFIRNTGAEGEVVNHLSQALQNVLTTRQLQHVVQLAMRHTGLLGVIGIAGVLWGGSNIGGAISTVFQPVFLVRGRPFLEEKLIDIGMIFVFTILMVVIVAGTTAGALIDRLFSSFPLSGLSSFVIGTLISLAAAFLLFSVVYIVFPNIHPRFKLTTVWRGALIAAILFQILSYVWPIYAKYFHFQQYGAVLAPIVVLTAWIYFFSVILLLGAEFVAVGALSEAKAAGEEVGPEPDGTVPQRAASEQERQERAAEIPT